MSQDTDSRPLRETPDEREPRTSLRVLADDHARRTMHQYDRALERGTNCRQCDALTNLRASVEDEARAGSRSPEGTDLRAALERVLRGRARGGLGWGFNADMHEEEVVTAILADPGVRAALGAAPQPESAACACLSRHCEHRRATPWRGGL